MKPNLYVRCSPVYVDFEVHSKYYLIKYYAPESLKLRRLHSLNFGKRVGYRVFSYSAFCSNLRLHNCEIVPNFIDACIQWDPLKTRGIQSLEKMRFSA